MFNKMRINFITLELNKYEIFFQFLFDDQLKVTNTHIENFVIDRRRVNKVSGSKTI
jgi:hypothetical protein